MQGSKEEAGEKTIGRGEKEMQRRKEDAGKGKKRQKGLETNIERCSSKRTQVKEVKDDCSRIHAVIRFVLISVKFGLCTVVGLYVDTC
jgi:hypothetical protein